METLWNLLKSYNYRFFNDTSTESAVWTSISKFLPTGEINIIARQIIKDKAEKK